MGDSLSANRRGPGLAPTVADEDVPESVRVGLVQILERCFKKGWIADAQLYRNIWSTLGLGADGEFGGEDRFQRLIKNLAMECDGAQFCKICEIISRTVDPCCGYEPSAFRKELNDLFRVNRLPIRLVRYEILKVDDYSIIQDKLDQLQRLLGGPEFAPVVLELRKAMGAVDAGPRRNLRECVRLTLVATEGVCKMMSRNPPRHDGVLASDGLSVANQVLQVIKRGFGFSADSQGQGTSELSFADVELIISVSGDIITYLIRNNPPAIQGRAAVFSA